MNIDNIPWNATAFQVTLPDGEVCRATAVIFQDGRVIGNIADGILRSATKANQIAYHEKFLKQHLQFAGAACRIVLVQHVRAFEDAMAVSVRQAWTRWGKRDVLATFDAMPRREHEFNRKGQGLLFGNIADTRPKTADRDNVNSLHCPGIRERLAHYGVFY